MKLSIKETPLTESHCASLRDTLGHAASVNACGSRIAALNRLYQV